MQFTKGLGSEDINTFTVCLRFNIEFLRPELTEIFSYSTFIHDNSLESYLWLDSHGELSLGFCKYWGYASNGITKLCSTKILKSVRLLHDHWHHTCWLVNIDGVGSDQIEISKKLFLNGKVVEQGDIMLNS